MKGINKMTPSDLKYSIQETAPNFFSKLNMKFFGDTMKNFGVRSNTINGIEVWELYRKKPVKRNLQRSHYFRKDNLEMVYYNE